MTTLHKYKCNITANFNDRLLSKGKASVTTKGGRRKYFA